MRPVLALIRIGTAVIALVLSAAGQQTGGTTTGRMFDLPELGLSVFDARSVQPDGRVLRDSTLSDGTRVDLDALRREDHALGHARRGQLSPDLHTWLSELAPDEQVQLAFWLRMPAAADDLDAALRSMTRGVAPRDMGPAVRAA